MKVVHISTHGKGGAAVACFRITEALRALNVDAQMLIADRNKPIAGRSLANGGPIARLKDYTNFLMERFRVLPEVKDWKDFFMFSIGNVGTDLSTNELVLQADIIHLHWINHGFVSLNGIEKLIKTGKPIIWTMHDMWEMTGGCHISYTCTNYEKSCGNCPYLRYSSSNDLSHRIWQQKLNTLKGRNIRFVSVSKWQKGLAQRSSILAEESIQQIYNPIDLETFNAIDRLEARKRLGLDDHKLYLLFAAINVDHEHKGFKYLREALDRLKHTHPQLISNIGLIVFGRASEQILNGLPVSVTNLGTLNDINDIVTAYSSANAFVIPSLQESLGQTAIESMACRTPAIGFRTNGIPEVIDHLQNGYLADTGSAEQLANGIVWLSELSDKEYIDICSSAREKVVSTFNAKLIAQRYKALYQDLLS